MGSFPPSRVDSGQAQDRAGNSWTEQILAGDGSYLGRINTTTSFFSKLEIKYKTEVNRKVKERHRDGR